ncbi:MAG: hypothetical protein WAM95_20880 [Bacillus sp. (in: firmicutes)]
MTEPRALKILNTESIKENESDKYYIHNFETSKSIQIPKSVIKTIMKIHQLPNGINHIFVDVLATAIHTRRLENITETLDSWTKETLKKYYIPECKANRAFQKLIETFFIEICPGDFTENEIRQLIYFFAKCPHGYDVTHLIGAHSEFNPLRT